MFLFFFRHFPNGLHCFQTYFFAHFIHFFSCHISRNAFYNCMFSSLTYASYIFFIASYRPRPPPHTFSVPQYKAGDIAGFRINLNPAVPLSSI
uniref:Putative secreted protein n=1 Tax=Anopheles darlingi TaxID=43151 RepID=A0A2M4DC20_ANODA